MKNHENQPITLKKQTDISLVTGGYMWLWVVTGASAFKVLQTCVQRIGIIYNAKIDHLSTKYLRALQLGQVDRLLHLVLVAVSLVGGTPFIILNAILLTLIKKSGQPY